QDGEAFVTTDRRGHPKGSGARLTPQQCRRIQRLRHGPRQRVQKFIGATKPVCAATINRGAATSETNLLNMRPDNVQVSNCEVNSSCLIVPDVESLPLNGARW